MKKYPLFPSQLGVFLECLAYPDTTQYNLPFQIKIDLCEDVDALVGTWKRLICATPTLRTRFEMDGEGNAWQWPEEDTPIDISVKTMREAEAADYMQGGFVRPFDILGGEPLFRIEIIRTEVWIHLLLDFHHLVVDGFSYSFMTDRGFKSFFQGTGAKQPDHLFFELAEQEEEYFASEEYRTAQDYFASSLKGADFTGLSPVSAAVGRLVSSSEYMDKKTVDEWCRKQGVDAPSLFQAAFALTLGRLARTEEPAYLTSYLNRATRQRMKAQGMLVNQVAIKANLPRDLAALDFIREMGETSARAYAMGRYPFIHLSKELGVKPRATFNFRPVKQILNLGDRKYSGTAIPRPTGQMDMNLDINLVGSDYEICATSSDAVNSEETVKGFTKAVKTVLLQILDNPAVSLQEISLTGEEEAREIMALSQGETLEYNASETWLNLFRKHVKEDSGKIAVVDSKGSFTYGELDQASDSIAAYLLEKGVRPGSFVALQMGRVKEFLAAVIAVHKVGAAYVPIDPEYPEERIHYMQEDSEAHVVLTEETIREAMAKFPDAIPMNRAVPEGRAYMIYTSGSTGKPKGVVIRHKAMTSFVHFIRERWHLTEKSRIACHSTFSFDASVEDLYPALTVGGCVCIVPEEARRDIFEMKAFLKKHAINGGCYSTQFGQLLASGSEMMDLDYMCVGGEAMTRTLNVRGPVYNTYGPTEFTVDATYFELEKGKDYASIPIGRPVSNAWAFVCDTYGHLLPQGMTGELCLAGSQLAEGYWKQPELTAKSFVDCSFLPGQKMYRTGDLARYNEEGQLEYLGRIDTQVKLRGFRIEMGEIESRAGQFNGIKLVAAAVKKNQLVLYYTTAEGVRIDREELRKFLAESLTDYMVPTVYLPLSSMPMTPSDKIDRKALPEPDLSAMMENILPETKTEQKFYEIAAELLGTKAFGVTDNLVSLGLSSLGAIRLAGEIYRVCDLRIPVAEILRMPTIRSLAAWAEQRADGGKEPLSPYPKREQYPITENQRGILIDWEQNRGTTQYNIPQVTVFDGVEGEALVAAVKAALSAHGYLKTRFAYADGDVVQQRRDEDEPAVCLRKLDREPDEAFFRSRILPFDLFSDRLYRMEIYTFENRSWLFADIHHTVYDGISGNVFMDEVRRTLKGENLKGETLTAYDFALYEKELQESETYAEAKTYFDGLAEGAVPAVLADSRTPDGKPIGVVAITIPSGEIKEFCQNLSVTPGSFFQAAFGEALRRLTREARPFYLTVESGRSASPALMDSVGMFVKTLPVAALAGKNMTSKEYVRETHGQLQEIYARAFYPYTELVENHGLRGEIMFVYQDEFLEGSGAESNGFNQTEQGLDAVKLPISVDVFPAREKYVLSVEYDGMRYSRADMESFATMVKHAALGLARQTHVKEVSLVSAEEGKNLLELSAGETLEYNQKETWLDLFLHHAKHTPEKTAVVDSEGSFTYGELDSASNSIAEWLLEKGVRSGSFVALKMGRVKEFMAAVIAVHKVGAAYVPIDPEYPEERIHYMLEDSETHVVLTEETIREAMAKFPDAIPMNRAVPEGRAYMIYTSGSTGKPKGVVIRHKAMTSFVHFIRERWHLTEKSRIACHSTFSFDASVEDLYPALTAGGCVFIVPEEARRDIFEMKAFLKKNAINGGCYSTQFGQLLAAENEPLDLDYIVVGGEAMTRTLNVRGPVYNTYGPTEFTVDATYFELEKGKDYASIPIGRPVSNAWAFVCDTYGHLLPQGMTGELCLAGSQLAEGYWKQPELTAKSFVDCPFLPGQKMYRTGDLVRYNEEGQLEYLGRIDTQVKLRGFRIEMGEIETRAGQFAGIESVAAEVRREQLVLYYTSAEGSEIDAEELRHFMSQTLADYMVPTAYVPLSAMPMTPSGKIDRKALPEPEWKGAEYVAPVSETERALAEAFGEILGIKDKLGASEDFFLLGGDSIKAIRLVSRLRERGIRVSVSDIMSQKTVRRIASRVEQSKETAPSQEPYEGQVPDTAIVSFFKDLALPEPWHYNQCLLLSMKERAVLPALQKAMDALAFQHDLLRAVWRAGANVASRSCARTSASCASVGAKQSHHAPAPTLAHPCASEEHLFVRDSGATLAIEEYQASSEEEIAKICNDIQSHIHMEEALVRVALIHGGEGDLFFIAAHHLVVDGVSWRILSSDLEKAYEAALSGKTIQLPEKTHTYRDYAETLRRYRDSFTLRQEIPYWKAVEGKMKGLPLSKAKDYSRSLEEIVVTMDREGTAKFLRGEFEKIRGNVNDALLAAVGRSFARVQGVTAVSFQMEGHGREDLGEPLAVDRTVGWFTSIYPVVVEGLTEDMLHDLLATKEALHRVPNKGVGYNVLRFVEGREKVDFTSELAAQIGFNYLGDMSVEEREGDSHFIGSPIDTGDSFSRKNVEGTDLSINCHVMDGCFSLHLAYARNVYDRDTAQAFAQGILDEMQGIASFLKDYDGSRLTATDLGENEWSEEEFEAVLARFAERGERIERIYPLLPMQEGMLLKHVTEPESWAYRLVDIYEMDWVPEERQLRHALARLGKKHEVLRTAVIHEQVSVPRQAIIDRPLGLSMRDLSGEADPEAAVKRLREEILAGGFDLEKKPLFRLTCAKKGGESCYLLLAVHHIIVDGWCTHRYMGDLVRYLKEEKQGKITEDTDVPQTGVYESAIRELLRQDKEQGLAYWRGLLEGYETKAEIPSFGEVPEEERAAEDECHIALDEDTTERLVDLCRKAGATPGNGIELLWGLVLSVCSRSEDVVFAKVVSGRDHTEMDVNDLVGLLINSVPVRLKLKKTTTAQEALTALQEQAAESSRYDYCPLSAIQQQTELGANLFQTVLAFENYNSGKEDSWDFGYGLLKPLMLREENFDDISPSAYIMDGRLHLNISFQPSKYREKEIRRVLGLFKTLAEGIVRHPEQPLSSMARLNPEEREEMLRLSRGEELEYNKEETWLDLFQSHAKNTPEKTAVVDSKGAFAYGELERASDSIAAYLLENGAAAGDFVVLKMGRVKEFLAAVIAVHKAGAAYVPIDPEYPEERIRYMLEDSEAHVVLTEETVAEAMAKFPDAPPMNRAVPEGRAYMIYTSGSTGKPKGVVQSHRSLRALVAWRMAKFGIAADSVHAEHASFSFDTSLNDLITPLAAGGILHIIPEEMRRDMAGMKDYFAQNHVNGITLSTQIGMAMVNQYPDMPLRYLMMGGEKMLPCKKTKIRLINEYGPTEFTVCASYHVVEQDKDANIPIGRPVPNTYSFICDSYGHLLPQGMAGELCLAGSQIAEGYWKKPELTAKSFVECSFLPGQKMYRTGDLARYNEEGGLEYLGRMDHQVKLRGFRIEMGEIETRAVQFAGIEYVAAAVKKDQLILYYTSAEGAQIDVGELRSFLAETLTEYMVPTVYMPLALMPMTPNGKIDRKALPEPDISLARAVYEAPVGDMERRLCAAFEQVLGLETGSVGRNDDFFLLGGSSIKAMLVMTGERIEGLSTRTIFKHKTPRRIAEAMSGAAAVDLDGYEKMARARAVPATSGQLSMIDYQFTNVNSVMHNLPAFYRFDGELDAERLAAAVDRAAKQHPALSTVFDIDAEGVIVQRMVPDVLKKTVVEHVSPEELKALSDNLMQPFHIFRHPLFRARVFRCDDGIYLFMDMHHTISDGVSQGILMEDIARAYRQEELEPDYYYSYVLKEHENQGTEEYKEAERYFDRLLSGRDWCIIPTPDFDSWGTEAGEENFQGIVSLSEMSRAEERLGVSRNILAIAAAMLALREYCQRDEIRIDYINNNRTDAYLQHTVGLVFKIFPMAVDFRDFPAVEDFLREVNRQLVDGFAHSICDYGSFDKVALEDALDVNYITNVGDASDLGVLNPRELALEASYEATECRVELYLTEEDGQVNLDIDYQKNAYAEGSMKKFMNLYVEKFRQLVQG